MGSGEFGEVVALYRVDKFRVTGPHKFSELEEVMLASKGAFTLSPA